MAQFMLGVVTPKDSVAGHHKSICNYSNRANFNWMKVLSRLKKLSVEINTPCLSRLMVKSSLLEIMQKDNLEFLANTNQQLTAQFCCEVWENPSHMYLADTSILSC